MSKQTAERLDELGSQLLEKLSDGATKGIDFIESEAPEVCKEILILYRIEYSVFTALSLFTCIFLFWAVYKFYWKKVESDDYTDPGYLLPIIISVIASLINFCVLCSYFCTWAMVMFAPRLFILNYLAKLIR